MDQSQSQTIHQVPSAQDAAAMCTPGAQMPGQVGMYTQFGYAPSAVSAPASQAPVQAAAADASAAASPAGLKDAFIMTSAEKRIPLPQAGSANLVWKGRAFLRAKPLPIGHALRISMLGVIPARLLAKCFR